jgi:hypothetical protein
VAAIFELPSQHPSLQPSDNLLVHAMDHTSEVHVFGPGVAVANDDIAIGEGVGIGIDHRGGAGRCLLSGATALGDPAFLSLNFNSRRILKSLDEFGVAISGCAINSRGKPIIAGSGQFRLRRTGGLAMRPFPQIAIGVVLAQPILISPSFAQSQELHVVKPVEPGCKTNCGCNGSGWGGVCENIAPFLLSDEDWKAIKQKSDANRALIQREKAVPKMQ